MDRRNFARRAARRGAWTVALAAALCAAGCATPGRVANGDAALPAGENSAAFLDRLSAQADVNENDAFRGVLIVLDGQDPAGTFAERVEALRGKGALAEDWDFDAARPITKGKLAYVLYRGCGFGGGVVLTLVGPSPRYCLREFQYNGMMSPGSALSPVTGMELVAVLSRADVYRRTGQVPDRAGDVAGR